MRPPKINPTRNGLQESTRIEISALLQARMDDSTDLLAQSRQVQWKTEEPNSLALHQLFGKVCTDLEAYRDAMAGRLVQLGGRALESLRPAAPQSLLPEFMVNRSSGKKHVAELAHALGFYSGLIRRAIELANNLEDSDTVGIFTEISLGLEGNLWFVEAHNQGEA